MTNVDDLAGDAAALDDFNSRVIEEFRANGGKVGGPFAGADLLLLTTVGAKSGKPRTSPLVHFEIDGRLLIVGSYAGAPKSPAWVHNLRAHPEATVELGADTFRVTTRELPRDERDRLYPVIAQRFPAFGEYQAKTTRVIPIFELTRG
ncbi:nitroreductase family deazaflavin-dependent oxidoreductase [Mycobacterium sp. MYCO198283]|uniref:nitroreductase family deazaflavin-dependent oxidoreductase n=1 Tax=Mycobacterium sp. MYCO198283 TaxID=2883505 RepID=UPI001E5F9D4C|nr:nitroreductase family deazaflavin-dependent oxidoreductase [Mycobacterium sp. MYCO198283]MCG5433650.1 nitroreductase family deazaflavin-dependent oxidoreductase [Mycobacterium sp. MYCO198283]